MKVNALVIQLALSALLTEVAIGQAFFELTNRDREVNAPVFDAEGKPLTGTNYLAELWGSVTPDTLTPLPDYRTRQRAFAPFLSTNGYFRSGSSELVVDNVPPLGWAWLQVRVWDTRLGPKYEDVAIRGLGGYGASPLFYAQGSPGPLCDPPCIPALLLGLQSFRVSAGNAVLMRSIKIQGNEVVIEWFGGFARYQLQDAAELSVGWQDVGFATTSTSATNSLSGGMRFFRVIGFVD